MVKFIFAVVTLNRTVHVPEFPTVLDAGVISNCVNRWPVDEEVMAEDTGVEPALPPSDATLAVNVALAVVPALQYSVDVSQTPVVLSVCV
jgi:hypothetical protein